MPKTKNEALTDALALVLLDLAGGPVPLKLILHKLEQRGVEATQTAVINALKRNPDRFYRERWGVYGLALNGSEK